MSAAVLFGLGLMCYQFLGQPVESGFGVYFNQIPIYPIFYLLKGDCRTTHSLNPPRLGEVTWGQEGT